MPSYTTSLRLIQPATGEYSGTWGTQVNTGITALVDSSIAGTTSITMTAANYTLTTANGAADESRAMFLVIGGTPGAAREVIVPAVSKLYFVTNNTTGGFAQTVKTASGSGISVPNGASMTLRCDGTNVVVAQNYFASLTLGSALPVASGGTGTTTSTGSGSNVLSTSPTLTTPVLGAATATSVANGLGAVTTPSYTFTGDTNTGMWSPAADTLAWSNNGVETMRLDASGQLSVGAPLAENSTGVYLLPTGEMRVKDGTEDGTSQISIYNNNTTNDSEQFFVAMNGADVDLGNKRTSAALKIFNSNTECARIDSSGNLLVGTTTGDVNYRGTFRGSNGLSLIASGGAIFTAAQLHNVATTGDNTFAVFDTETTATRRGSIDYNRAGGLTRYNTTSDYRAKDIIGPVQNPGATIDALTVYEGKMKGATQSRPMMIAHEAQAHVPFCVSGDKDEENEDGTPKYQQMDHASLVPLLIAEIQSLRARVAALEAA